MVPLVISQNALKKRQNQNDPDRIFIEFIVVKATTNRPNEIK